MANTTRISWTLGALLLLLATPILAASPVTVETSAGAVVFTPQVNKDGFLTIAGPEDFLFEQAFAAGETVTFQAVREEGALPRGSYSWEIYFVTPNDGEGDRRGFEKSAAESSGRVSGSFSVRAGAVVDPDRREGAIVKDIVHLDDVIIDGSLCVGFDCVNGENFGFDTLRLKENNVRIHFDDTSNSGSFPANDWRIVANDSSNGGLNYLGVEDSTAGRIPFRVEAGARANALYVEADGDVGIGTSNPAVDLEVVTGNTPTLRLQQDGSSGFTPQTWDVAGNEANFFVRDVTNGSKLSFRIRPGAPESSIDVAADGDVGIGTSNPDGSLHVNRTTGAAANLLRLTNNSQVNVLLENTAASSWFFSSVSTGDFTISKVGTGRNEMLINGNGDATLQGTLTVCANANQGNCGAQTSYPDYVFEPGYNLMPLQDLAAFVGSNKHLPNVPTVDEVTASGINMTKLQLTLLEKVEELTLYTLQQQEQIDKQQAVIDELRQQLETSE